LIARHPYHERRRYAWRIEKKATETKQENNNIKENDTTKMNGKLRTGSSIGTKVARKKNEKGVCTALTASTPQHPQSAVSDS
jgi:hypothetical protein